MLQRGFTLIELLVVVVLVPLVGLTLVQLDLFTQNYFRRTTDSMIPEQEVELALGAMARDILTARTITVFSDGGTWAIPVNPGVGGNGVELIVDDENVIPPVPANFDVIRYWLNGAEIIREYAIDGGAFDAGRPVARNITNFALIQTVDQVTGASELLPDPFNVIRATVEATFRGRQVVRTRYITSRTLRAGTRP